MTMLPSIADLPLGEGVTHVAVTSPADVVGTGLRDGMTVFWHGDRPIGHVLMHEGWRIGSHIDHVDADFLLAIGHELQRQVGPAVSASVVICTRDRPDQLAACLASLPQQSYRPHEIIVVDNASSDQRTHHVALAAGVIYVREDRPGLDIARNTGVLRATGDIVAFTDDDVLLHPKWLERLVAAFDRPQVAAVTGLVLPAEIATEAQRHFETYWGFGKGYRERDFDSSSFRSHRRDTFPAWEVGAGASMAFRRDVFERIGLFDERLDVGQAGCSGDSEYWYRPLRAFFRGVPLSSAHDRGTREPDLLLHAGPCRGVAGPIRANGSPGEPGAGVPVSSDMVYLPTAPQGDRSQAHRRPFPQGGDRRLRVGIPLLSRHGEA
jgi:hypothetical protein